MTSRDKSKIWAPLCTAWEVAVTRFIEQHGVLQLKPFLTCTFRSKNTQADLYAQGRTAPGKRVTNAKPGESLHNYDPCFAFDVGFTRPDGTCDWSRTPFELFAEIMRDVAPWVEWGGEWRLNDLAHFQVRGYHWELARKNAMPSFQ